MKQRDVRDVLFTSHCGCSILPIIAFCFAIVKKRHCKKYRNASGLFNCFTDYSKTYLQILSDMV